MIFYKTLLSLTKLTLSTSLLKIETNLALNLFKY